MELNSMNTSMVTAVVNFIRKYGPLLAAFACVYFVSSILYVIVSGRVDIGSALTGFLWAVLLAFSLYGGVHFFLLFIQNLRCSGSEDSNTAAICLVEVCINNETVLTVRSWWPIRMTNPEVEKHGVRVAMSSARRWLAENAQAKVKKVKFNECVARKICNDYLCEVTHPQKHFVPDEVSQCSVCLDDLETGCNGVSMKKCGHVFHEDCLSAWIAQSSRLACVICREDHSDLLPLSLINEHTVKEEPTISVLTVAIEQGSLVSESH